MKGGGVVDLSQMIQPDSAQLDAVDLLTGPRTFTIESVSEGAADQPVNIFLADFPRPWRPGKSMRRVLVACWGPDGATYVGRRVRLFCDPTVRFGGQDVGGTRIEALSNLDKPRAVPLLVSRGKSATYVVQPLADAPGSRDKPLAKRATGAVEKFAALGVTVDQLAAKVGHPPVDWTADDLTALLVTYTSIQRGETTIADEFPASAPADDGADPWGSPA